MLNFLKYFLAFILISLAVVSSTWLILWKTEGARLFSVQSDSMKPVVNRGDLIIDLRPNLAAVKPGDVVSYYSSKTAGEIVTHRVVINNYQRGYLVTKGDNLTQADPPVPSKMVIGRTLKSIPKLGYVFDKLHTTAGLIGFVYVPAAIICLIELWIITGQYKHRPYQLILTNQKR